MSGDRGALVKHSPHKSFYGCRRLLPPPLPLPAPLLHCTALTSPSTAAGVLPPLRRFRTVALVSKRFQAPCLAPQLLCRLDVSVPRDAAAPPRTAALPQFLAAHAAHVRELRMAARPLKGGVRGLSDSQLQQLSESLAAALGACAAAPALRLLRISAGMPLSSAAWLPALQQLQQLRLGSSDRALHLPAATSGPTALRDAALVGSPLALQGALPPGLTRLHLEDAESAGMPRQVRP